MGVSGKKKGSQQVLAPVHDWTYENQRTRGDYDNDETMTYFWTQHTLTVLALLVVVLMYVAIIEPLNLDTQYNTKRGLVAMICVFTLIGITHTPDGPFLRPHPALWRLSFIVSIVYELALIFVLFQAPNDARSLLKYVDTKLGVPVEEKSYGGNCTIYDSNNPDDPFHNIKEKMDLFVPAHMIGWYFKMLIVRDWWMCWVISVAFEVLEYTLEHQLPNFLECWWDHWILDAVLCNGLGIYLGGLTLEGLEIKNYYWRGLWDIPTYRGKLKRMLEQFSPKSWDTFDWEWNPTLSLSRWLFTLITIFVFLLAELNTFYLKFVLWVPPDNYVNLYRLVVFLFWGAVSIREIFQFLDDPTCTKIGKQAWLLGAIIATEFFICLKFGWETVTIPLPRHIAVFWIGVAICILCYTVWMVISDYSHSKHRCETEESEDELHNGEAVMTPDTADVRRRRTSHH